MKLHFAGADGANPYNKLLLQNGAKGRLESFFALKNKHPSNNGFDYYLLDSGGFVARTKNKKINVEEYANYLNRYKVISAFNLDTNDVKETQYNYEYLKNNTDCKILRIYHLSDYINNKEFLYELLKFPYIGVGGVAGENSPRKLQIEFYNFIFKHTKDRVKVHGLGISSKRILQQFPWFSVDATNWLSFARYGNSRSNDKRIAFFKAKTKHYLENTAEEIKYWVKVEDIITRLWEARGIIWEK